jgi:hypothetical protein
MSAPATTTTAPATKATAKKATPAKTTKATKPAPDKVTPIKATTEAKTTPEAQTTTASTKIRWQLDGERDDKNRVPQHGTGAGGVEYRIAGSDKTWVATATKPGGKPVTIAEGGHTKAYTACVKVNAEMVAKVTS